MNVQKKRSCLLRYGGKTKRVEMKTPRVLYTVSTGGSCCHAWDNQSTRSQGPRDNTEVDGRRTPMCSVWVRSSLKSVFYRLVRLEHFSQNKPDWSENNAKKLRILD